MNSYSYTGVKQCINNKYLIAYQTIDVDYFASSSRDCKLVSVTIVSVLLMLLQTQGKCQFGRKLLIIFNCDYCTCIFHCSPTS